MIKVAYRLCLWAVVLFFVAGSVHPQDVPVVRRILTVDTESQPAVAGDSIKPGVERSETPGTADRKAEARGSGRQPQGYGKRCRPLRGLSPFFDYEPGVPQRSGTPV